MQILNLHLVSSAGSVLAGVDNRGETSGPYIWGKEEQYSGDLRESRKSVAGLERRSLGVDCVCIILFPESLGRQLYVVLTLRSNAEVGISAQAVLSPF